MKQYTILTKNGLNKLISASANQTTIKLKYMAVGDGSGEINQDATALQNERHRFAINAITINQNDSNILEVEGVLQADIGGFYVREAGIFCDDGSLFAIAKVAESYKPLLAEGSAKDITISFQIQISNTNLINLKVDNNVVLATRKWVLANFSPLSHTHDEYLKMYQKLPRGDYSSEVFWNGIDTGFYSYHPEIGGSNAPYGHGVVLVMSAGVNSTTKHILWFAADSKGSCYERRQSGGVVIDWRPLGQSIYDDRYLKKRSSKLPNGDTRTSNYWSGVEPGLYFTGSGDSGVTNRPIINGVFHVATWGGGAADKVILAYPATDERKIFKLFFTGAGQSRNWVEISDTQAFLAFNQASKVQNGYQKLPSGVIIQWGSVEAGRSSLKQKTRINFPIAFPNSCFSISLATRVEQGNENANAYFSIYSKSNAYAEAVLDNYTPDCSDIKGFDYMAIGH